MALITWSDDKLSVGVKMVDAQHGVLVDIINELHDAMLRGQAQSLTGPLLRKLLTYTNEHFSAEEAMLAKAKYDGLEGHKTLHRGFVRKIENYAERFERGEITLNLHLMNFLRDWLVNHIQKIDRSYRPCLVKAGMQLTN